MEPHQIVETLRQLDDSMGQYPSRVLSRVTGQAIINALEKGRERLFNKTRRNLEDANETLSDDMSPKLVNEILRQCDGVTNEDALDLWAGLLAKALSGQDMYIRPAYFETLSKMSPADALIVKVFASDRYDAAEEIDKSLGYNPPQYINRSILFDELQLDPIHLRYSFESLVGLKVLQVDMYGRHTLTIYGRVFCSSVIRRHTETSATTGTT